VQIALIHVNSHNNNNNNNNNNNSIYLCAKLNSPGANYKVSTGKKMGRVRSKKVSENNVLIKYNNNNNNNNNKSDKC
jgi:hypothetical protein